MSEHPVSVSKEEAREHLRSQSLYIATPAFGGLTSVNYVTSLLGLTSLCRDLGIKYTVSFMYNESLIPRARNKLVHKFLTESDFTQFLFLDADIGFNPEDILSMMLFKDAGVIGAPYVRKNFNWRRIVNAIRKHPNKKFTDDELNALSGEYIINLVPELKQKNFDLGELTEVLDVGTGMMRIMRCVFDRFQDRFPERWYAPLVCEDANTPVFTYFNCGIDTAAQESGSTKLPHYLSEDFMFCQDCRRAGVKVYLAPWINTSHSGTHMFLGNLSTLAKFGEGLQ